eukprot:g6997.t1
MEGGAILVVCASNVQEELQREEAVYLEVAHEGTTGQTHTATCLASPSWKGTLTLPLDDTRQGCVKVSVCSDVPPSDEQLAELAFEGKQPPPPLGFVRVPVADLAGLERSRPFTLEGTSDDAPGSITLGFTVVEDGANSAGGTAAGEGEGTRDTTDPRSVSGIFSTSDFSVDPPLPARSSPTQSEASPSDGGGGWVGGRRRRGSRVRQAVGFSRDEGGTSSDGGRGSMDSSPAVPSGHNAGARRQGFVPGERGLQRGSGGSRGGSGDGSGSDIFEEDAGRHRGEERTSGRRLDGTPGSRGGWTRGIDDDDDDDDDDVRLEDGPARENVGHRNGSASEGGSREAHGGGSHESGSDHSSDLGSEGLAALLQNIADEENREEGASEGREYSNDGDASFGGDSASSSDGGGGGGGGSSSSSSNFEFSSAQPVSTLGDLWGNSGGGASRLSEQHPVDTPRREEAAAAAAERLEVLTAAVAATVAEVAAETCDQSSNKQHGFLLNTSSIATGEVLDTSSEDNDDSSSRNPVGGLPIAGSRSPKAATATATAASRPGQRELDSESNEGRQDQSSPPRRSIAGSSSEGFAGGLPLAGSRSPPAARRRPPGRREPDSSDVGSSDFQPPAAGVAVTRSKSPRRAGRRRRRRRPQDGELQQQQQQSLPAERTAAAPGAAPLDSLSPHGPGFHPAGSGDGNRGSTSRGRRQRDDEYRAEGRLLRSHNRSEVSWWEKENTSSDGDEEEPERGADGYDSSRGDREREPRGRSQQRQQPGRAGRALLEIAPRPGGRRQPKPAVSAVEARKKQSRRCGAKNTRQRPSPPVVWRRMDGGGQWAGGTTTVVGGAATGTAAAAAAAAPEEPGPGLRATHFAPGYVGVAWPDPLEEGATTRHLMAARERLLAKLEEASARKIAGVEGKSLRARRERAERVKRRNLLLEKQVRREIRDSIEEQERRLQRQLEAARRRQAGAEAAADAAAAAAAGSSSARPPSGPGARATLGIAARERAEAVRRRRAMLEADEARAKVYAFKRKGELRTQALLRGVVRGAKSEEDIAAAAEAFEVAAEGAGGAGGNRTGAVRGPVIASGAPRSTWESWNEQRRSKAEEVRLQGEMEKAFKALDSVAALRRDNAVGARRDRARESNAKAEEGHGRARKRLRMQAETAAARVEARARGAATAAATAEAERRERAHRGREMKARRMQQQQQQQQQQLRRRRASRPAGRRGRQDPLRSERSPSGDRRHDYSLMEVLGDAKAVMDDDGGGGGRDGEHGSAPKSRADGRGSGDEHSDVWVPSTAAAARAQSPPSARAQTERQSAWAEEDNAVARRLAHLDTVAARLEEAGAEIEANIDLLGLEHSRLRRAVDLHHPHPGPAPGSNEPRGHPDAGWTRTDEALGGGGRGRWRRRERETGSTSPRRRSTAAARGGRAKARGAGSVVSRRLVAPTVSSKNKATSRPADPRAAAAAAAAATRTRIRGRGTTIGTPPPARSPSRRRTQKPVAGRREKKAKGHRDDDSDGLYEAYAGARGRGERPVVVRMVGSRGSWSWDRAGGESWEGSATRGSRGRRRGGRRGGERRRDDVFGSEEEEGEEEEEEEGSAGRRSGGRRGSGRPLYSDYDGRDGGRGYYDDPGSGGDGESGTSARRQGRPEMEEQGEDDERIRGRRDRSESSSLILQRGDELEEQDQGRGRERGLLWESGTRSRARYSEEHKEAMESVSSDAMRMRAIKDDLSDVLQRLREGDVLSTAATAAAEAAAAAAKTPETPRRRHTPAGAGRGQAGAAGGAAAAARGDRQDDGEEEELAAALYGTYRPTRGEDKTPSSSAAAAAALTGDRRRIRDSSREQLHTALPRGSSLSPVAAPAPAPGVPGAPGTTTTSMTLQVSALADLEARIASLGGILNSFSSEDGGGGGGDDGDGSSARRDGHHNHPPESFMTGGGGGEGSRGAPRLRPLPSPPPQQQQQWRRERSPSPVPRTLMGVKVAAPAPAAAPTPLSLATSSSSSPRYSASVKSSAAAAPSLLYCSSPEEEDGEEEGRGGGGGGGLGTSVPDEAGRLSGAASALAREVDALLRASGGSGGRGGERGSTGAAEGLGAGGDGLEEKTEGSSLGWSELEGMAQRLGALAAGGSGGVVGRKGAGVEVGGGGGSGYSSGREYGSISSRG